MSAELEALRDENAKLRAALVLAKDGLECAFRLREGLLFCTRCKELVCDHAQLVDMCEVAAALAAIAAIRPPSQTVEEGGAT